VIRRILENFTADTALSVLLPFVRSIFKVCRDEVSIPLILLFLDLSFKPS
jgi:hypothetical protein